jgi:hypothetical protein
LQTLLGHGAIWIRVQRREVGPLHVYASSHKKMSAQSYMTWRHDVPSIISISPPFGHGPAWLSVQNAGQVAHPSGMCCTLRTMTCRQGPRRRGCPLPPLPDRQRLGGQCGRGRRQRGEQRRREGDKGELVGRAFCLRFCFGCGIVYHTSIMYYAGEACGLDYFILLLVLFTLYRKGLAGHHASRIFRQ